MYEKIEDDALLAAWFFARSPNCFRPNLRVFNEFALALTSPTPHSCCETTIILASAPYPGPVATHARTATSELAEVEACAALLSCCWHSGGR
jgi:hypothetical protein